MKKCLFDKFDEIRFKGKIKKHPKGGIMLFSHFYGKPSVDVDNSFQFTVLTTGSDETFTLPIYNGGTYDFTVDWGDGSALSEITAYDDADRIHTYAVADTYTIKITGTLVGWSFNNGGDKLKIRNIDRWGILNPGNGPGGAGSHFRGCTNLTVSATDVLDLTNVTTTLRMFRECSSLTSIDLSGCDVSSVTTMLQMFYLSSNLESVGDLGSWDVSSVTTMERMFYTCSSLTSTGDIGGWDVSSVTTMYQMFYHCFDLTSVGDLDNWDVGLVATMESTFDSCSSLSSVGDIGGWNVSSITTMYRMFISCSSLLSVGNLGGWDVSSVAIMESVFNGCSNLSSVGNLGGWDVSSVTNMANMFLNANSSLSTATYDSLLIGWSALTLQSGVFFHADSAKYSPGAATTARAVLTGTYGWTITDGGQVP